MSVERISKEIPQDCNVIYVSRRMAKKLIKNEEVKRTGRINDIPLVVNFALSGQTYSFGTKLNWVKNKDGKWVDPDTLFTPSQK